jgi:cytochrome c-type biogenesis protein
MTELNVGIAFIAGLVSFLAPCVLPIIPGFLAYLSGSTVAEAGQHRKQMFLNSIFFVAGFSAVFAAFGVLLNTVLEAVAYDVQVWLSRIGGTLIIFFGLYLTGLLKIPFLNREYKFKVAASRSRYATSLLFGAAFAAGWTPCVGAALGSILGLAATAPGSAFYLLLAYSLGLGLPFVAVGLFTAQATALIGKYARFVKYLNIAFGILLIALGVLIFTQQLSRIASFGFLEGLLSSGRFSCSA